MRRKVHTIYFNSLISILIILFISSGRLLAQKVNTDSLFNAMMDHNNKGLELIKIGEKAAGIREYNKAADDYNDYDYWTSNKRDSTEKIFTALYKEHPESPVFAYIMGSQTNLMKRDEAGQAETVAYFKKALQIEPGFGKSYSYLASIAAAANNYTEAIEYYKKAIGCDSTRLSNYFQLSYLLKKEKNEKESQYWSDKMIQIDSTDYYSIGALIEMAKTKTVFKEKYDLFSKAFRLAKDDEKDSPCYYFINYLSMDAPDTVIAFCNRLLSSKLGQLRSIRIKAVEGIFNCIKKSDKNAIPAFAEKYYNFDDPRLLSDLGRYFADSLKSKELALKYYLKAYEIASPETVENTMAFGGGSTKMEFMTKVAKSFKEGSMAMALGKTYYKLKDYKNAEKYLREAIPENEKNKSNYPHQYLGYCLAEAGKKEEAVQWLVKALTMKNITEAENKLNELIAELKIEKSAQQLIKEERMKNAKPATDFSLADLNGKIVQLSKLKGKVVMLDFWGTWCGPCVSEMPQLVKLYEKYKDNPNIIFFGVDINEQPLVIKKFMEEKKYSFNVLIALGATIQKDYEVTAVPTKFLIDKQGRVQFSHIGYDNKEDVVEVLSKELDELLKLDN